MKRRRRLNINSAEKKKKKPVEDEKEEDSQKDPTSLLRLGEMMTARGKLMGALKDAIDPPQPPSSEESDSSEDLDRDKDSKTDADSESERDKPLPRTSYVLKLFDRSVDLSQFNDDTPLYPICRAWMLNQPKANYKQLGQRKEAARLQVVQQQCAAGRADLAEVQLPPAGAPPAPRPAPALLRRPDPRAAAQRLDDILLGEQTTAEGQAAAAGGQMLRAHLQRWGEVRAQHTRLATANEARYARSQALLDSIVVL